MRIKTSFIPAIFFPSIIFIVLLACAGIFAPIQTNDFLTNIKNLVFVNFSWFLVLAVSFFVGFMILLALSKFGDIKLGFDDSKPEFSFSAWICMLFAAGMGVGLMYFGVAEPLIHKNTLQISSDEAMLKTVFHWGIHPWAIYGVCALAMAYFGFRYKMPLSLRSAFYPFLKDKIYGFWGNIIDILALVVSVFGISTTLGYSAMQLNAGFVKIDFLEQISFTNQIIIIFVVIFLSVISTISGVKKGIKRVSEINLILALFLMIFVLFSSDFVKILSSFSSNLGIYFSNIVNLSFKTYVYENNHLDWFNSWTVFYWAWWLSWSPFVGFFIAKISKGRTIREFIFGVLIVPTTFNILWFSIFGNSALNLNGVLKDFINTPEMLLFNFLEYLPMSKFSSFLAIIVLALFFITSANSGIFVLNSLASGGREKEINWQSILWGVALILLSSALLYSGGLDAILCVTMIVALPFALLMVIMSVSLFKGLIIDKRYFGTKLSNSSVYWSGEHWEKRLALILKQPQKNDMQKFIQNRVKPAMQKIINKLNELEYKAYIEENSDNIKLVIEKDLAKNFIYGVKIIKKSVSDMLINDENAPTYSQDFSYEPKTFFDDGRLGYDIQYMIEEEIIVDILKQYERYLRLLNNDANEIFTKSYENL